MRGWNANAKVNAQGAFSLVELMSVSGLAVVLLATSARLWTGMAGAQQPSPRLAAASLAESFDEARQLSQGLELPVAVAFAEARDALGKPETRVMLLRPARRDDPEIAVGWPVRLGLETHWRQEGEVRRFAKITLAPDTGPSGTFTRPGAEAEAGAEPVNWRLLALALPQGGWSQAPANTREWAILPEALRITLEPETAQASAGAVVQVHPASPRAMARE